MARTRCKWKCLFFTYIILINVFTKSLPIKSELPSLTTTDTIFKSVDIPIVTEAAENIAKVDSDTAVDYGTVINSTEIPNVTELVDELVGTLNETTVEAKNVTVSQVPMNATRDNLFRQIRPGQEVQRYALEISVDGDSFAGRAVLTVILSTATREDPITLHVEGLNINSVQLGVFSEVNVVNADFGVDDGVLEIFPSFVSSSYIVIIEYGGQLSSSGHGLHLGRYNEDTYLAMNLHPTNARRVFPCMDEPTEVSIIGFTFNNVDYTHMVSNSMLEENTANQFRALQGPPHLWGMVAHNFINVNIPTANVLLYGRQGNVNQDAQASVAINYFFNNLNEWTDKPYFEILLNQDGRMNIIALPDVSTDWNSLSTVGIWEPYVFMESTHSVKQRKTALTKIAEAMARQWFGFVIFPENWRYEWVVSGLASYAGFEMLRQFQDMSLTNDITMLDVNTIFVTDIIQESLLRDAYTSAPPLEPDGDLFDEGEIRNNINGLLKYKAPAIMRMMRLVLGDENQDFIQTAGRALLNGRALQTVNSLSFIDALNSEWLATGNGNVGDIAEYLEPWVWNNGYPLLRVDLRQNRVFLSLERFGFSSRPHVDYLVPITFTTSVNPNFDNVYPVEMTSTTHTMEMALDEEDWILFNIQGQGYYRVTYNLELWEVLIEALEDPERREQIHPLNRATLVDDALNLARAGMENYDIAFRVVLSMEHETEYAVWKAFIRNMDFIRKRLVALVTEDEDLDPDIYLRMVRRTIGAVENELGFYPDVTLSEPAMTSLTRGLVMDHACRANYQPCIAAAVDWFYDPNNNGVVNPNIPHEIRPAVYCTMVREGDDDVIAALYDRLAIEPSQYERVVILESLACSQDDGFIRTLLDETLAANSPYLVEERAKIFAAVAESSFQNAGIALEYMRFRTPEIRNMYGGPEKLEELIFVLADNMADFGLSDTFSIWIGAQANNLDDSEVSAERALAQVTENLQWNNVQMNDVYEWIDENDAPTFMLSTMALCLSMLMILFIH